MNQGEKRMSEFEGKTDDLDEMNKEYEKFKSTGKDTQEMWDSTKDKVFKQ